MSKKKIVVMGGGAGSLSALFYLTKDEDWQDRFDITLYQLGWRLGGKGASGRNVDKNHRIEEHGVHLFFGCYENAFRLMDECYANLGRAEGEPLATAFPTGSGPTGIPGSGFSPRNDVTLMQELDNGKYVPWELHFPDRPGKFPGGKTREPDFITVISRLAIGLTKVLSGLMSELPEGDELVAQFEKKAEDSDLYRTDDSEKDSKERIPSDSLEDTVKVIRVDSEQDLRKKSLIDVATEIIEKTPENLRDYQSMHQNLSVVFEHYNESFRKLEEKSKLVDDEATQISRSRSVILGRLISTLAVGMLTDEVYSKGFDHLDKIEFTAWLQSHGLDKETEKHIWWSPIIRGLYEMVFGFAPHRDAHGDMIPDLSTAAALRGITRFFGDYEGSFIWEMNSGMGDTIFVPLYQVLKERGVKFRFFHRVDEMVLSEDGETVEELKIGRQIESLSAPYSLEVIKDSSLEFPISGNREVIVGRVGRVYHFRVFNHEGKTVADLSELDIDAREFEKFEGLLHFDGPVPDEATKKKILDAVWKFTGHHDTHDYDPLVTVPLQGGKSMECWPSLPVYEQLNARQAARLQEINEAKGALDLESSGFKWGTDDDATEAGISLKLGEDFDEVIIGVGLGAIPHLINRKDEQKWPGSSGKHKTWEDLVDKLKPLKTKGAQLWMNEKPYVSSSAGTELDPRVSGFGDKWPSWIGMSHVKGTEAWDNPDAIQHIAYLFAQVADQPDIDKDGVKAEIKEFLENDVSDMWESNSPVIKGGKFDPGSLYPDGNFDSQYFRVNSNHSDLYVPAPPGTLELRPWADECGLTNGYVAADWARNGFNCGCVEAAVMSGMKVARALCGNPGRIYWEHRDFSIKKPTISILPGPGSAATVAADVPNLKEIRTTIIDGYRHYLKMCGQAPKGLWPFLKTVDLNVGNISASDDRELLEAKEKLFYKCFPSVKVLDSCLWKEEIDLGFNVATKDINKGTYSSRSKIRIIFKRLLNSLDKTLFESREEIEAIPRLFASFAEERKIFIDRITPYIEEACENETIPKRVVPGFLQKLLLGGNTLEEIVDKINSVRDLDEHFDKPSLNAPVEFYSEALWIAFLFVLNYHRFDDSDASQDSDQIADEVIDLYFRLVGKNQVDSARNLTSMIHKRVMGKMQMTWRGDFTATVMPFKVKRHHVESLLPFGISLNDDEPIFGDSDYHPVLVLAGRQANASPDLYLTEHGYEGGDQTVFHLDRESQSEYGPSDLKRFLREYEEDQNKTSGGESGGKPKKGYEYLESFVLIPYVNHNGKSYCFSTVLYLDKGFPTEIGNLLGLKKRVATLTRDESSYRVEKPGKTLLDVSGIEKVGEPVNLVTDTDPEFEKYRKVFGLPHIADMPTAGGYSRCETEADISEEGFIPGRVTPTVQRVACKAMMHSELCRVFSGKCWGGKGEGDSTIWEFPKDGFAFELNATWVIPPTEKVE